MTQTDIDTEELLPFDDEDQPYCLCCGDLIEDVTLLGSESDVCWFCREECEDYEDERW